MPCSPLCSEVSAEQKSYVLQVTKGCAFQSRIEAVDIFAVIKLLHTEIFQGFQLKAWLVGIWSIFVIPTYLQQTKLQPLMMKILIDELGDEFHKL